MPDQTISETGNGKLAERLRIAKNRFAGYRDTFQKNRQESLVDIDYYHGHQLSQTQLQKLYKRGQPDVIINRIRVAINGIIGVVAKNQTDPIARHRTPSQEIPASIASDCLRYSADKNRLDARKKMFLEDMLVPGTAAAIVEVDRNMDVMVRRIRWEEYFIDPRSREVDGSDKEYDGIAKWMYNTKLAEMYPDKKKDILEYSGDEAGTAHDSAFDEASEDRPITHSIWYDRKARRVMVVEMYYREMGQWRRIVYYGGGVLEEGVSAYQDEYGRPRNPIECISAYVDRNNNRYGHVRDMRSIQDEINKRRSKLLHLANSSQIEASDISAVEVDSAKARQEAARPDGVIPFGWTKVRTTDMTASQAALLSEAKNEIERFSPNPAVLGRQGADSSGRALLARQQAGLVELALLLDGFEDFEVRIYRGMWMCMKQFWDMPKWIRVTKDEDAVDFLMVNEPTIGQRVGLNPETGFPEVQDYVLGYKNQLSALDVDITIDAEAETATIMQEMVEKLMALIQSNPNYANEVPFEIFMELLPIPRKHQIINKLKAFKEQQAQASAEDEAQQRELIVAEAVAKVEEIISKTELNKAKAEAEGFNAQSTMMSVVERFMEEQRKSAGAGSDGQTREAA